AAVGQQLDHAPVPRVGDVDAAGRPLRDVRRLRVAAGGARVEDVARRVELHHAVVARVGDPRVARRVVRDALGQLELPGGGAGRREAVEGGDQPELAAVRAVGVEALDPVVERVGDGDAAVR